MNFETPILLIVFNRPDKTQKLFERIKEIQPRKLFVSADGPRLNNESDKLLCKKTRDIFNKIDWDCDYQTRFSEINLSCKKNVIDSIDWFFSENEEGIILEDDCIPNISFFNFCKILLKKHRNNKKIMQINGTNLDVDYSNLTDDAYFFSKLNHTWGWASWRRAWIKFDKKLDNYPIVKKNGLIQKYYVDNEISNWMIRYFDKTFENKDNIWSSNWSFSILIEDGLCISPTFNLVKNIGFDGSGTSGKAKKFAKFFTQESFEIVNFQHPKEINYNLKFDQKLFYEKIKPVDPRASMFNLKEWSLRILKRLIKN